MTFPTAALQWGVLPVGRSSERRDTADMTSTTIASPQRRSATGRVVHAWGHSSPSVRFATVAGAGVGIACAATDRVSAAAGLSAAVLVAAALVDLRERRLPNRTVALALLIFVGVGIVESAVSSSPPSFRAAALGSAAFATPVLALHLASPRSMGFGDVKLSAVLGTLLGSVDWRLALWALAIGSGGSAVTALATNRSTVAFGPGLVAATLVVLAFAATVHAFQVTGS